MIQPVSIFGRLVIGVMFFLGTGPLILAAALEGGTVMGGEIPLMDGATIVKESLSQGSGRVELEVDASPGEVASFYNKAMEEKGWPSGSVMSAGNQSVLMLNDQGDQFILKAESENERTRVIIVLIRKAQTQAATGPLSPADNVAPEGISSAPQSETIPQDRGMTIEGAPPAKGSLVQRLVVPPNPGQGRNAPTDPGSPPDDPSPDPEEPSDSNDSDDQGAESGDAADETPEILPVSLHARIKWVVNGPEESWLYEGSVNYQFSGVMKLDAAGSPAIQKADRVLRPVLTYKPEAMTVSYSYDETYTNLVSGCLVFEYQGGGSSMIDEDYASGLKIIRFSAAAAPYLKNLSADKQQFLAGMESSPAIPDYYEFRVAGPGQKKTIPGRKNFNDECTSSEEDEKDLTGLGGGVQIKFPESGAMGGTRTWSADDQGKYPPRLSFSISDIEPLLTGSPFHPPEGGNRNVTYNVSWGIGETANMQSTDSDEEDEKWHCKELQKRINFIQLVRALYANENIRKYVDQMGGDLPERRTNYQWAIEQLANKIGNDGNLQTIDQKVQAANEIYTQDLDYAFSNPVAGGGGVGGGKPLLNTDPVVSDGKQTFVIHGHLNGEKVPLRVYDDSGFMTEETPEYWEVKRQWETEYFGNENSVEVGQSMFSAAMKHEKCHVDQWVNKGPMKSLDDMGERELEAYNTEMQSLLDSLKELGCDP